ncbi:IS3 family transposase [Lactococcus petauri]|uniref:IS3 family transposase n=1 Tax=Lactococcus petauri TaxID=1940789 RepID=UPI0038526CF9
MTRNNYDQTFKETLVIETLGKSRSTYYAKLNHEPSQRQLSNEKLSKKIKTEFFKAKQHYGASKIHAQLLREGERCSLKRVQKLMGKLGLRSIIMKKGKVKSFEAATAVNLQNLLKQDFSASTLNQKWTTDITYIHTQKDGWCYLSSILDLCLRKIIAWDLGRNMETDLVIQTLNKVVHRANHGLILQTDQGSQYLSNAYEKRLNELGIRHSYSLKGYPYDNSAIESFHASLKKEEDYQTTYPDFGAAKRALFSYIESWYNQNRIHSSIGYQTPNGYDIIL